MSRLVLTKTSFTAGEIDPRLLGRLDLKAVEDGARRLRNVVVQPTGGVARRPGTRIVTRLDGACRLVSFDGSGGALVAFADHALSVVENGAVVTTLATPWPAATLDRLDHARLGDRLLIVHPDHEPQRLARNAAGVWSLTPWLYAEQETDGGGRRTLAPFVRFAAADVTLQPIFGTQPPAGAIPVDQPVLLRASADFFTIQHLNVRLRVKDRQVRVTSVQSPTEALALTEEPLQDGLATRDWQEQAFSAARGWPATLTFHQDRLVIGGSRDLPDRLWFSRTGRPFDFEPVEGLSDEPIAFRLAADGLHRIASLHPGRHLQVFTSAGEWVVKGFPLTPESVQADLQTRVGAQTAPRVRPVDVDGATLFVGAAGNELREFLFTDTEQAYQAADLAMLSRHLLTGPIDMAFDTRRRLLWAALADGEVATLAIDRNSNVAAWSRQSFAGRITALALHAGELHLLAERDGHTLLLRLDDALQLDEAVTASVTTPSTTFAGFGELAGSTVHVVADGVDLGSQVLDSATITLPGPVRTLVVGLAYTHEVEPAPPLASAGRGLGLDTLYRPTRLTFRVLATEAFTVDVGNGPRRLLPNGGTPALPFTGDLALRALGWRRGLDEPTWRIVQSAPAAFTLLAATTELKVED